MNALVPAESPVVKASAVPQLKPQFFDLPHHAMIVMATEIATSLRDIIERQELYVQMNGKKYVRYEGWLVLGSILGILPKEDHVREMADGSYEATVNLLNFRTGMVIGGASAICTIDEQRWGKAPKFSRRSMAVTRATAKAYRLTLSWIMALAGYEPTPEEEMPSDISRQARANATQQQHAQKTGGYDPNNIAHIKSMIEIARAAKFQIPEDPMDLEIWTSSYADALRGMSASEMQIFFNQPGRAADAAKT